MAGYSGIASYGALGHVLPRLPTISFLVHFEVNLTANYRYIVSTVKSAGADVNNSQLFRIDQYCISHKTISHRAAAAPSLEVRRECPSSQQILATPLAG